MKKEYQHTRSSVIIILVKEEKILMFKRKNTGWSDGDYTVPSGHIEKNELPTEAAVREVKEEIGVIINPEDLKMLHVDYVRSNIINFTFVTKEWQGVPKIIDSDKSEDLRWFNKSDLPENIAGHGKKILQNIEKGVNYFEIE